MKVTFTDDTSQPPYGFVFLVVVFAAGVMTVLTYPLLPVTARLCVFHEVTGIPCPTCGATRCGLALLAGDPVRAFLFNPLVFLGGLAILAWGLASFFLEVVSRRRMEVTFSRREGRLLRWGAVLALAVNWAWLIYSGV